VSEKRDNSGSNAMWGGRFAEGPSAIMREINASIPFDKALWRHDIEASKAHVAMLGAQGIVTAEDMSTIAGGLDKVAAGLLVGIGTRIANGCTSGHGVCGISRFSFRGMIATVFYILAGGLSMVLFRHILGVI